MELDPSRRERDGTLRRGWLGLRDRGPFSAGCSCDSGGAATALAALPGVLLGLGFRRRPR